jgi:AraC family cel operon transcriptional repressor
MAINRLRWDEEPHAGLIGVVRHCLGPGFGWKLHDHEFFELFWVEHGAGRHLVNGRESPLTVGDVACIRPDDAHAGTADPCGMTIVNVTFPADAVVGLADRHPGAWPWRPAGEPVHQRLPAGRRERLWGWGSELARGPASLLDLEAFLLDLCRLLAPASCTGNARPALPSRLAEALEVFADPRHLPHGPHRLAGLAGCGIDHLNRLLRRHLGRSTTEVVAGLRLDRVAHDLRMGDAPVADLARQVGLANLGHFHAGFRRRFGVTPGAYRRAARAALPPLRHGTWPDG